MSIHFNRIGVLASHEHAAMVTYREALSNALATHLDGLREIQADHEASAQMLQSISQDDITLNTEFGVWELMSKALMGLEKLYGKHAALQSLLDCESMAIHDYEACLRDNGIPYKGRTIIIHRLIPQAHCHIKRLDQLMNQSYFNLVGPGSDTVLAKLETRN